MLHLPVSSSCHCITALNNAVPTIKGARKFKNRCRKKNDTVAGKHAWHADTSGINRKFKGVIGENAEYKVSWRHSKIGAGRLYWCICLRLNFSDPLPGQITHYWEGEWWNHQSCSCWSSRGKRQGPALGLNNWMNLSGMLLGAVDVIASVSISQERENRAIARHDITPDIQRMHRMINWNKVFCQKTASSIKQFSTDCKSLKTC